MSDADSNRPRPRFPFVPARARRAVGRVKAHAVDAHWALSPAGRSNAARLRDLRGACAGRRAWIVCNGPSLNAIDLSRLADEVTIGSNAIFLKQADGFVPTYFTVEDELVAQNRAAEIDAYQGPVKVLPRDLSRYFADSPDTVWVDFRRRYRGFPRFSDTFERRVFWGGSVTFMNLQLAYFLGCSSAILIGADHSWRMDDVVRQGGPVVSSDRPDANHFDPNYFKPGMRWNHPVVERIEVAYACARDFGVAHRWPILNATVGGHLEVFPRVDFDDLLPTPDP